MVVYKVDRLSRSLMDFARIMEVFEKHQVSFVSVTQQFNITHSMGRLTLNILLLDPRSEGEDRTMLAAYVETASQVTKLAATEFFGRYGEIGRVVNHLNGSPDITAFQIYELYQRHGKQVVGVVDEAIAQHASAIRNRELPDSSLLRLVCDTAVMSAVSPTATPTVPQEPQLVLKDYVFRKKG